MIEISNEQTYGWEETIRGMRNPMTSWNKIDSKWDGFGEAHGYSLGANDLSLMKKLAHAGADHGKFLRMINVTMDITAPLYWWKEFDTYKVGTVANSCSTMHKIHAKEFVLDDFSHEELGGRELDLLAQIIEALNANRENYNVLQNKFFWHQMIQLLPSSYNQKRTVQLNYQVLKHIYPSRKNHKLDEWRTLCGIIENLPYAEELIC